MAEEETVEQEGEPLLEEPQVAVAEAPPSQARTARTDGAVVGGIQRTVTDKMMIAPEAQQRSQAWQRSLARAGREPEKVRSDREFLEEVFMRPESNDCHMRIVRILPSHTKEGVVLDRVTPHRCGVMDYDSLREEILNALGGGDYRVTLYNKDEEPLRGAGMRCVIIRIPTTEYAPKTVKYAGYGEPEPNQEAKKDDGEEESLTHKETKRQLKEQTEIDLLEERKEQAAERRAHAEIKNAIKRRELAKLQRDQDGGGDGQVTAQLEAIRMQREQDRRDMEAKLEAERKETAARAEAQTREMLAMFKELVNKPVAPPTPPDTGMKDVLVAIQQSAAAAQDRSMQLMGTIVAAMKPTEAPKSDNSLKDVLVAISNQSMEGQKQVTSLLGTLLPAMTSKPDTGSAQVMEMVRHSSEMVAKSYQRDNTQTQALVANLLNAVVNSKQGTELTPDTMLRLIEFGDKRLERHVQLAQNLGGGGASEEGESPAEGYDPKLGFMGNIGKGLFYGMKKLPELALQYPQVGQFLINLFGSRQPTEAQMAAAAARMERQGMVSLPAGIPPSIAAPPQMQQIPYHPQQALPPGIMGGAVPPSMRQAQVIQQPLVTPAPQPQPEPEQIVNSPDTEMPTQAVGETGAETIEGQVQEPEAPPPEPSDIMEPPSTAEERLREVVSNSISMCVTDILDKVAKREWPEDAYDFWHGDFKKLLLAQPDSQRRLILIQQRCHPDTWRKLVALCAPLQGDPPEVVASKQKELLQFYSDLERLCEMCRAELAVAQVQAPPVQQAPAQAPVATTPPSTPPPVAQPPAAPPPAQPQAVEVQAVSPAASSAPTQSEVQQSTGTVPPNTPPVTTTAATPAA